jgi:Lipocalin-like domain
VQPQTELEVRQRLLGTWKLVSTEETLKDGSSRPFAQVGSRGKGFLLYQTDGYMCAHLFNPDQGKSADPAGVKVGEVLTHGDGSFAYCGRYEIDVERRQIIHFPEIATDPGFVGSRQIRPYEFEGDRLIFSDIETRDTAIARWKIVWEKLR